MRVWGKHSKQKDSQLLETETSSLVFTTQKLGLCSQEGDEGRFKGHEVGEVRTDKVET